MRRSLSLVLLCALRGQASSGVSSYEELVKALDADSSRIPISGGLFEPLWIRSDVYVTRSTEMYCSSSTGSCELAVDSAFQSGFLGTSMVHVNGKVVTLTATRLELNGRADEFKSGGQAKHAIRVSYGNRLVLNE